MLKGDTSLFVKNISSNITFDAASWRLPFSSAWRRPASYVLIMICFLFSLTHLTDYTFNARQVQSESDIYGPVPALPTSSSYNFFKLSSSFKNISVDRINELDKKDFRKLIMSAIPRRLKKRLRPHLAHTLEVAERYELDPFWVLSIMWTESHFNTEAKSYVSATGLMQIMPGTGRFLAKLMDRPYSHKLAMELIKDPKTNIEMGVFYLKRMAKSFNYNYRLATVAYNMGPGGVRFRLRNNLPVGVKNEYLDKVRHFHALLVRPYHKKVLSKDRPYKNTYAVKRKSPRRPLLTLKSLFGPIDAIVMKHGVKVASIKSQTVLL